MQPLLLGQKKRDLWLRLYMELYIILLSIYYNCIWFTKILINRWFKYEMEFKKVLINKGY